MSGRLLAGGAALLLAATVVAYIPVYRAGFIWDDNLYVTDNANLRALDGLRQMWGDPSKSPQYYPLTFTTFWIEYQLWGLNPAGYHVVNVILHGLNAVLVWLVLRQLGLRWAWWVAAIFALHPVHVQSVAWVTERKNTLSGLFYLLSTLAYLRFCRLHIAQPAQPGATWRAYALALPAYVAALLSKTTTVSLPATMLLLLWWKRRRLTWRDIWPLLPFFVLGVGLCGITYWAESRTLPRGGSTLMFPLPERILAAGHALWFYAGKLLCPYNLAHIYPRWPIDMHAASTYVYAAAALAVPCGLWWARRRLGTGPLVAVLFFGGTLFPTMGIIEFSFIRNYTFVADHFLYLPSLGIIALLVAALHAVVPRLGSRAVRGATAIGIVALLALGGGAWQQSLIYRSEVALWRDTLAKNPACEAAHHYLAIALLGHGQAADAIPHLETAVRLGPRKLDTLNDLANAYAEAGRFQDALPIYQEVVQLNPNFDRAFYNLGVAYARLRRYDEAAQCFRRTLEINPQHELARKNLATLLRVRERSAASQSDSP